MWIRSKVLRMIAPALALALASVAVASTAVGATMSRAAAATPRPSAQPDPPRSACLTRFPHVIDDGFPEPKMLFSRGGRLDATLRMVKGKARIDGHVYDGALTYNGTFPGPTLLMCPGDDVRLHVVNEIGDNTNLHVHGLHVDPRGDGDNVFLKIPPGGRQTYRYHLPRDHDTGAFWYHPHLHEHVSAQIFGGLSGAIVVAGGLDKVLAGFPQRLMMIQSTELCAADGLTVPFPLTPGGPVDKPDSGREACPVAGTVIPKGTSNERFTPLLINGEINPTVNIREGSIQRWRIFNANNNRIVVLRLAGHSLQVLAEDGSTLRRPHPTDTLMIGPGSRREVLVRGGGAGTYRMTALPFAQFPDGDLPDLKSANGGPTPNQTVLTVRSSGKVRRPRVVPDRLARPIDLRRQHVDRRREICFAESNPARLDLPDTVKPCASPVQGPPAAFGAQTDFKINGETFHESDVHISMQRDSVEEWTLVNSNTEWHTFHIHVNPFQVISIQTPQAGLRRLSYVDYQDNIAMPPNSRIVIRMKPTDFVGKFVIHCHVTTHEDHGMMAPVEVVAKLKPAQRAASAGTNGGVTIRSSSYGVGALPAASAFAWICRLLGIPVSQVKNVTPAAITNVGAHS